MSASTAYLEKYLRDDELSITVEELKKRKKAYYEGQVFFNKLCTLVTRIQDFLGTIEAHKTPKDNSSGHKNRHQSIHSPSRATVSKKQIHSPMIKSKF